MLRKKKMARADFIKDAVFWGILVIGLAAFFFVGRPAPFGAIKAYAQEEPSKEQALSPKVIAATFSSAWCSSCKVLEPRLDAVAKAVTQEPISFLSLDFTFGQRQEHKNLAQENGFLAAYEQYKGGTGFALLLDARSGAVIDVLTKSHSKNAMRAALHRAIAWADRSHSEDTDKAHAEKPL